MRPLPRDRNAAARGPIIAVASDVPDGARRVHRVQESPVRRVDQEVLDFAASRPELARISSA